GSRTIPNVAAASCSCRRPPAASKVCLFPTFMSSMTSICHLNSEDDIEFETHIGGEKLSVLKFRVIFRPSELHRCSLSHVVSSGFCLRFVSFLRHAKLGEPVIPKRMSHERCVAILRLLLLRRTFETQRPGRSYAVGVGLRRLRERLAKGESVTALATEYGVSRQTVYNYKTVRRRYLV